MKSNQATQGPSVQAVVIRRPHYSLWSLLSKEQAVKAKEVVISGHCRNVTTDALLNKVVDCCKGWILRVQVHRNGDRFMAWTVVNEGREWEFMNEFNKGSMIGGATARPNGKMRASNDVVIVGGAKTAIVEIEKWAGKDNIDAVEVRGNSAIVSTKGPSYAQALMEKQPMESTSVRRYVHKVVDPMSKMRHTIASLQQQLEEMTEKYRMCSKDILTLRKEVSKLGSLYNGLTKDNETKVSEQTPNQEPTDVDHDAPMIEVQRLQGIKRKQKSSIQAPSNFKTPERRGRKRDAEPNEVDEAPCKVHVAATPKGTVHIHKTVPAVVIEHESDSDFE